MVELLEDLEAIKKHAERCREILYMIEPAGSKVERIEGATEEIPLFRVRLRVGKYGWDRVVDHALMNDILRWLRLQGAFQVVGAVSDEFFFA